MLMLIGKQHSKETTLLMNYLNQKQIAYSFMDLEDDEDAALWRNWTKANKILSIPVLLNPHTHQFCVGYDLIAIEALTIATSR